MLIKKRLSNERIASEGVAIVKDAELKLISELMKNCHRSDRQLAKAVGISQPTVSRLRSRLEKNGFIREYAALPDFTKLGYRIFALTFVKLKKSLNEQQIARIRKIAQESMKTGPFEVVMLERGLGLDSNGVFASYHEDYSAYMKFVQWIKQFEFLELGEIKSFLVNLDDEVRYRPWTYSTLAKHVLQMK
jgi:DNA-binding Lrp family transcriptional regulator